MSVRQLAHELNSLLDGASRCVALAERRLPMSATDPRALANLHLAQQAHTRMAELLETAMSVEAPGVAALASRQSLRAAVERVIALLGPMAEENGVALRWSVDEVIGTAPCGLVETVLVNALRNGIDAAAAMPLGQRYVDVSVSAGGGGHVDLTISDTGPGFDEKTRGHGIGLELCRQIVAGLGGRLAVTGAPFQAGTVLTASIPLDALHPST